MDVPPRGRSVSGASLDVALRGIHKERLPGGGTQKANDCERVQEFLDLLGMVPCHGRLLRLLLGLRKYS